MKATGKACKRQSPNGAVPNTPSQVSTRMDHDGPVPPLAITAIKTIERRSVEGSILFRLIQKGRGFPLSAPSDTPTDKKLNCLCLTNMNLENSPQNNNLTKAVELEDRASVRASIWYHREECHASQFPPTSALHHPRQLPRTVQSALYRLQRLMLIGVHAILTRPSEHNQVSNGSEQKR